MHHAHIPAPVRHHPDGRPRAVAPFPPAGPAGPGPRRVPPPRAVPWGRAPTTRPSPPRPPGGASRAPADRGRGPARRPGGRAARPARGGRPGLRPRQLHRLRPRRGLDGRRALPGAVVMSYSEDVAPQFVETAVVAPDGTTVPTGAAVDGPDVTVDLAGADLPDLAGSWQVVARVVSVDGHPVEHTTTFVVEQAAPPATADPTPEAPATPAAASPAPGRPPSPRPRPGPEASALDHRPAGRPRRRRRRRPAPLGRRRRCGRSRRSPPPRPCSCSCAAGRRRAEHDASAPRAEAPPVATHRARRGHASVVAGRRRSRRSACRRRRARVGSPGPPRCSPTPGRWSAGACPRSRASTTSRSP